MHISLVTHAPFPNGNVSTMRYSSYLKTLVKNGIDCHVIIYCPTRMAAGIKEKSGVYKGIGFQYATEITWKRYNPLVKVKYLLVGLWNTTKFLKDYNTDTVVLYGDNPFVVNLFFWIYTRITHIRYIGDRSELPTETERGSRIRMWLYGLKQRMFDGMIIMTKELMKFYSQYSERDDFLFYLPMTIDPQRFDGLKKEEQEKPYIAVVFGTHNRDGLLESLKAFDMYCQKGGLYCLRLIGDYDNMPNKAELDAFISQSVYRNRICILGKQPNDVVPQILYNASILLTTPNFYVSGGFPTKLGEYMLSRVPIVATEAGELLDYITADTDMIMKKPKDIDGISEALLSIENDKKLGIRLANSARHKALQCFCADSYVKHLKDFLFYETIFSNHHDSNYRCN